MKHVKLRHQFSGPRVAVSTAIAGVLLACLAASASAQTPLTWADVRARFEAANPTLKADELAVDESRANETTAFLRPNPSLTFTTDQIGRNTELRPFADVNTTAMVSYLVERQQKRELRRDSAQQATAIVTSTHADLDRTLVFTLRGAFVQVLMSKAQLTLSRDNLAFYDQVLAISRNRLRGGDIAQVDLDRLELQRVQMESAVETATVSLRTAKIQLLTLLDDRTPVDGFDVTGPFDFVPLTPALEDLRRQALDARPDLRAANQAMQQADTNRRLAVANGSADPVVNVDVGLPAVSQIWQSYTIPLREYVGIGVTLPLRIFDRNQGERRRTELDVSRSERLADAAKAQVLNDVDSAYATLVGNVDLLRAYKDHYLAQATRVRDTMTAAYERGGAALLDFLQAEQDYRSVQVNYVSLVGSYLTAAAQLNLAIGQEVLQ